MSDAGDKPTMQCLACKTKILDADIQVNGFSKYGLDIQLICPNPNCERTMSYFISDGDFLLDNLP